MSKNNQAQSGFFNQLLFYFTYGFRNIQRGGRWSTLAIFSVAAGVATIVALRGLGLSIGESLISTVREDNKGDILIQRETDDGPDFALLRGGAELEFFSEDEIDSILSYAVEREAQISLFSTGGAVQIAGESGGIIDTAGFVTTYLVDSNTYPAIGEIRVIEPEGTTFPELFTGGNDIVISENMAELQGLFVGDTVRVARTEERFTVRGIVGAESEAGINNIFAAFFGFAYFELETMQTLIDSEIGINRISLAFSEALTLENDEAARSEIFRETSIRRSRTDINTAARLLESRKDIAIVLGDFIVIMGLGAMLIGGVGIMNTMLVLVRRRITEIAALKTFGLKGRQVALLFLSEGILLGIIGSVVGCIIGVLLGGIVNQYGEQFIQQELAWRIYPEALLYGFALGMLTTVIFSIAPILTALQIRPAIILRPNENHAVGLGILQSLGLMILITILLGLIVGQIVQPTFGLASSFSSQDAYLWSVVGVAATLAILGILTMLLWVLVWFIGKLPAFGSVDLRLALRNMSSNRLRTATTLLALSAGMFALSSITFVGEGTRQMLNNVLNQSFGGNVLAIPISPDFLNDFTKSTLNRALEDVPGVQYHTTLSPYGTQLLQIDDRDIDMEALQDEVDDEHPNFDAESLAPFVWSNFIVWDTDNPTFYEDTYTIVDGRNLTPEDRGQPVLIGPNDTAATLGITVGSILVYEADRGTIELELVGLYQSGNGIMGGMAESGAVVPAEILDGRISPEVTFYSYQVDDEYIPQAVTELSSVRIPPVIAINVKFFDSLISRFIEQFAAIPTVVGLLSLFAAAIIMANTVALSTLERRRQIGVLKAIGLKSHRVLFIMLIESTIVGLLSAGIGIGLSSLAISIFTSFSGQAIPLPREAQGVAIALVIAAVLIGWISTFLSANVAVRERVMNVLRYE